MSVLIGLDLSLTAAGVCCLPIDWDRDPSRCQVQTVTHQHLVRPSDDDRGRRLASHTRRILAIAKDLAGKRTIVRWGIGALPTHDIFALGRLGELAGAVKLLLSESGASVLTVQPTAARKFLMGKLASGSKETVRRTVTHFAGCGSWEPDEVDAFVVANWLASECGGKALTVECDRRERGK